MKKIGNGQKIDDIINISEIKRLIPHRYPFLFIDSVTALQLGQSAIGAQPRHTSADCGSVPTRWLSSGQIPAPRDALLANSSYTRQRPRTRPRKIALRLRHIRLADRP